MSGSEEVGAATRAAAGAAGSARPRSIGRVVLVTGVCGSISPRVVGLPRGGFRLESDLGASSTSLRKRVTSCATERRSRFARAWSLR
jgi:hypothetical protein